MSNGLKFDLTDFNAQVSRVRGCIKRNAGSYVRTTARRLIRRLAYNAPKAPGSFNASGRLRAGFWPAALLLNISNIYTGQPNRNEGSGNDQTRASKPSFTIVNSVPYIGTLKNGMMFADVAVSGVQAQMAHDLEKYARDSWAKRDLIDDLSAE